MHRKSAFAMAVAWVVTVYLVVATVVLDHVATSPADHAAVRLLGILTGALGIVAFCLLLRWADEDPPYHPTGYRPLDERGEIDSD